MPKALRMPLLKDEFFDELNTSITCSLDQEDVHILLIINKFIESQLNWWRIEKKIDHLFTTHPVLRGLDRDSYKVY